MPRSGVGLPEDKLKVMNRNLQSTSIIATARHEQAQGGWWSIRSDDL